MFLFLLMQIKAGLEAMMLVYAATERINVLGPYQPHVNSILATLFKA
jgi:hypothetical protein